MVTKLKNINKPLIFLLGVLMMALVVVSIFMLNDTDIPIEDALSEVSYVDSVKAKSSLGYYVSNLFEIGKKYVSEEDVLSGEWIELNYYELSQDARTIYDYFESNYDDIQIMKDKTRDPLVMKAFIAKYPEHVEELINDLTLSRLSHYKSNLEALNKADIDYYFKNDSVELSNFVNKDLALHLFEKSQFYYTFDSQGPSSLLNHSSYFEGKLNLKEDVLYLSFSNEYIEKESSNWNEKRTQMRWYILLLVLGSVLALICLYILFVDIQNIKWILANIYLEVILTLVSMLIALSTILIVFHKTFPPLTYIIIFAIIISIISIYGLLIILKNLKLYKLKNNLIYKCLSWLGRGIGHLVSFLPFSLKMLPNHKNVVDFKTVLETLHLLESGDLGEKITPRSHGLYGDLIKRINMVRAGLEEAISNELKGERLKSELITNVSHDVRTPLTSIVTYLDLLEKSDSEEDQKKYIQILNQKVSKLTILIEDLFDAAKISSGSVVLNLENLDIKQLMLQVLGEHDDQLKKKELQIITVMDPLIVSADRKSIWRVVDNLIVNISKYAQRASRVYINVEQVGEQCEIIFKNISEEPLNIAAEELKLRFKRGDAARTTSGSGLGLAIAEDLMGLQGGLLTIKVDGDLFKATVLLNLGQDVVELSN